MCGNSPSLAVTVPAVRVSGPHRTTVHGFCLRRYGAVCGTAVRGIDPRRARAVFAVSGSKGEVPAVVPAVRKQLPPCAGAGVRAQSTR